MIVSIREHLQHKGHEVLCLREPGGSVICEKIRRLLKEPEPAETMRPECELLLMYAARAQLVRSVIEPALERGVMVICDRHDLSSFAYQGGGRGLPFSEIEAVRDVALGDFRPDLTLLMDIDPALGMQRVHQRGGTDRFEQEKLDFFTRVRDTYLQLARTLPYVKVIDASQSMAKVQQDVLSCVDALLAGKDRC